MRVLLDTSIFLHVAREEGRFLRGSEELLRKIARKEIEGLASCVALMEVKWVLYDKGESVKAEKAVSLIEELVDILPMDKETAKQAIDNKIARKLELLDSIHMTTALIAAATLVTRDKDLRKKCSDMISIRTPEEVLETRPK